MYEKHAQTTEQNYNEQQNTQKHAPTIEIIYFITGKPYEKV
jgi:hypothetical protein